MAVHRHAWKTQAACRDHDPELWFSPPGSLDDQTARGICAGCPVLSQCRGHALARPEPYGTWGGLDESQRDTLLRTDLDTAPELLPFPAAVPAQAAS